MSKVNISGQVQYRGRLVPTEARLVALAAFSSSEGIPVAKGSYQSFAVESVDDDGLVTLETGDAYASVDSTDRPNDYVYKLDLYAGARRLATIFKKLRIPASPTDTTWENIRSYSTNAPNVVVSDMDIVNNVVTEYLDAFQTAQNLHIDEVIEANLADEGRIVHSLSLDHSNSLATAVATIGSSKATLLVNEDTIISTAVALPVNIVLKPENGAKLIKSGSGSLTFSGVGIVGDPRHQIFSGFSISNLAWINEQPALRPEWFGGRGDNSTDNTAAFDMCLNLCRQMRLFNRVGGKIVFDGGIYKCASPVGTTLGGTPANGIVYNTVLEGNGTKAIGFGAAGGTIILYTGTGGGRAFDFRSPQGLQIKNLSILYNAGFTGTLLDFQMVSGNGGKALRISDCHLGGNWTSGGTLVADAAEVMYLGGVYDAQIERNTITGARVGIRLNPGVGGNNDTNVISIVGNEFVDLVYAGITNPYQGTIIHGNNFESINFLLQSTVRTRNGGMQYAISYEYDDPTEAHAQGISITGNWFGDRSVNGKAYIKLGRVAGGMISGNFFGGGFNSYANYENAASGSNGANSLTVAGAAFTTADIGSRIWLHGVSSYSSVITGITSSTVVTVADNFPSGFSGETVLIGLTNVREYRSNVSGTSGTKVVTISGVTLPTDCEGKYFWIPSINYVSRIVTRNSATQLTLTDNLPSTVSSVNAQLGNYEYNGSAIEVYSGSSLNVSGNFFGGGMNGVNVGDSVFDELTDISVTNGSAVVTCPEAFFIAGHETRGFLPVSPGWSVPVGTTIVSVDSPTQVTLSNVVTVTSGANPRRAQIINSSAGSSNIALIGNSTVGCSAVVVDPFTNTFGADLSNTKTGGRYTKIGNKDGHPTGITHDYTNRNWGFLTEDFGAGDGVIGIGNAETAPTSNPASGVLLYSQSNVLKVRHTSGKVSVLGLDGYTALAISDAISANTDDYGFAGANLPKITRYSSDNSSRELRGIKPHSSLTVAAGVQCTFVNVGANDFIVKHNAGTSTSGYRFFCSTGSDLTISPKQIVVFTYLPEEGGWYAHKIS